MKDISSLARGAVVAALLASLTGCGGGGGSDSPPQQANPPPAVPEPSPPPAPPPPPPAATVPPVSATVQDISDGRQVGVTRWGNPQTNGQAIGTFTCVVNPPQTFSLHTHLTILVNNEPQTIPRYVGAAPSGGTHCFYAIHTDDASGRIHVVSSAAGVLTLGQLFQIWGQPLTNTNVAGVSGLPVEIFVTDNGTVTKVDDANWSNIELRDHREITIGLGTPVAEIPNFTWTD